MDKVKGTDAALVKAEKVKELRETVSEASRAKLTIRLASAVARKVKVTCAEQGIAMERFVEIAILEKLGE